MKTVFDFKDYREFLKERLPVGGPHRGARNRLAEALNCQKGFVSQVLSGRSHFSLEHGMQISRFLELDAGEEEYFLLLLHYARAGSKDLEKFYDRKLNEIHERRKEIKARIRARSDLSEAEQMTYYSSWHYVAVHMCLFLPETTNRNSIAEYLGLPAKTITQVLDFLINVGLAKEEQGEVTAGPARIHLEKGSPFISKHHTNWRMRAIESLDSPREEDLHYSLVMSVDSKAIEKIREILLKTIQDIEPTLKAAADEKIATLNIDLFDLIKER